MRLLLFFCLGTATNRSSPANTTPQFSKAQIKSLQEAMYHSAENNHLDITIEIRSLGVPWTLHCWMHSLGAAHEARLDCVIDQLLQDFLQVCPDDYSPQFVQECLPLLFNIFRYSKVSSLLIWFFVIVMFLFLKFLIANLLTERRHYTPFGRYIFNLFWVGTHQTDKGMCFN